jgi:signal transduction histidine kinase/putative methionine-R-sulfoxide reductase with GAF domain
MDFYEAALQMGVQQDLLHTCTAGMQVLARALEAREVRIEVTDPASPDILGSSCLRLPEDTVVDEADEPVTDVEQKIGHVAVLHVKMTRTPRKMELLLLLSGRLELAWRSQLQSEMIRSIQSQLTGRKDMDRKIGRALAGVNDTRELAEELQRLVSSILEIQHTGFYFLDPETRTLQLGFAKDLEEWERADAERTAWDRHPGRVIKTGRTIDVPDTSQDQERLTVTSMRNQTIRSRLYMPVRFGNEVIGALGLASNRPHAFDDMHRDVLTFLADIAGLTWGRIREGKARERRERLLQATAEISSLLISSTDWQTVGAQVIEQLGHAANAESAAVVEFSPGEHPAGMNTCWPAESNPSELEAFARAHLEELGEGRTISMNSNHGAGEGTGPGSRCMIGVPIQIGRSTIAALLIGSESQDPFWDDITLEAIGTVARAITSSISRSRLETALRHSQKLEAIGTLAGGIAHDFNNLLWPILSYTQLLKDRNRDPAEREMLNDIEGAARRASDLVSQILNMSRHVTPNKEVVDLAAAVRDALRLLERSLPPSIDLQIHIEENVGRARIDVSGLHQVILNLCTNASQAMTSGGMLSVRLSGGGDGEAILVIEDEGIGMDEYTLAHLFDPYFTTKASTGGTGLGLTIVHRIIDEFGGSLETFSRKGLGTRQSVKIPLTSEAGGNERTAEQIDLSASPKGARILVVDDDEQVGQLCREILESYQYECEVFTEPRKLLERIGHETSSLTAVVTDLSMPEMNGIELTRCIRELDEDLPIICCTGFGSDSLEKEALLAGVTAFARKPLGVEEFGRILKEAIT